MARGGILAEHTSWTQSVSPIEVDGPAHEANATGRAPARVIGEDITECRDQDE